MSITFEVSRVARAQVPLRIASRTGELRLQHEKVEAMGASVPDFLPADTHGLIRAVHTAYALHYPLVLTPDAIWLAIAQGFAMHVNANSERLRGKFVRHEGRLPLLVRRNDFVKGSPHNPWPETFRAFSDAIAAHIGRQRDLVVCNFTTTGPCERAASEIVLLDAMQSYFAYVFLTRCGIPSVTLEGTADDWRAIRRRARALEEYDLEWWTEALGPVLDELVATAEGRVNVPFWETIFKHQEGSGGPWVGGWINTLLPYLRSHDRRLVRNDDMSAWKEGTERSRWAGAVVTNLPSGLSSAPFRWQYFHHTFPMELLGGFVGLAQDVGTLAIRPVVGWAVHEARATPEAAKDSVEPRMGHAQARASATLIAGRATDAVDLTLAEATALCVRVEQLGDTLGERLACSAASNIQNASRFPEFPIAFRFVVGTRVADVGYGGSRTLSIDELHAALRTAASISESTWAAASAMLSTPLREVPDMHLTFLGDRGCATLYFGEKRWKEILELSSGGGAVATVDISLPTHAARVEAGRKLGLASESARYGLYLP